MRVKMQSMRLMHETVAHFDEKYMQKRLELLDDVKEILYDIVKEEVRRLITHDKVRPDGRGLGRNSSD